MIFSATVSEGEAATSVLTGTLASGTLQGMTVAGVALAGHASTGVGQQIEGIFGSLLLQGDGTFTYTLDNADRDTDILALGDTAWDRFVVTYKIGDQIQTLDVDVRISGTDDAWQHKSIADASIFYSKDAEIGADIYLTSSAKEAVRNIFTPNPPFHLVNRGSLNLRGGPESGQVITVVLPAPDGTFDNYGRVTLSGSMANQQQAVIGAGTNNGVISVVHEGTPGVYDDSGILAWDTGTSVNNGLVEAISSTRAAAVATYWGQSFTNNGILIARGANKSSAFSANGSTGSSFVNNGTIRAETLGAGEETGVYFRPDNTNVYRPLYITNAGTIVARSAIVVAYGLNIATNLTNSGRIEGDLLLDSGVNVVTNTSTGYWSGTLTVGPESDLFVNAGTIDGSLHLAGSADAYIAQGVGTLSGTVFGEDGSDLLIGAQSADRLDGGDGNDLLMGGGGADVMTGGAGADTFAYAKASDSSAAAPDRISDFVSGTDKIDLNTTGATSFAIDTVGAQTRLTAITPSGTLVVLADGAVVMADIINQPLTSTQSGTANDDLLVAAVPGSQLAGQGGNDVLFGSAGSDVIDGGTGNDVMAGGAGNDTYYVDADGDRVLENAGDGIDEVRSLVDYSLQANVENMTLMGSGRIGALGNDLGNVMLGNAGANQLRGLGGDDTINGGPGEDSINPGTGTDRIVYDSVLDSTASDLDFIEGFEHGPDKIDLRALDVTGFDFDEFQNIWTYHWTTITVNTSAGSLVLRMDGRASLDDFIWNTVPGRILTMQGASGNKLLQGSSGNDVIRGFGGDDILDGRDGDDLAIYAGNRDDYVITAEGQSFRLIDQRAGGGDGSDLVLGIERFLFADGLVLAPNLLHPNRPPVARSDAAATPEDRAAIITVLANDTDADDNMLSVVSLGTPGHGSADVNVDGSITYKPLANYNGQDSFTYQIADGRGGIANATVTITVSAVNDAPDAVNDRAVNAKGLPLVIAVRANDTDSEGDTIAISAVGSPAHGSAVANGDGTITYTPIDDYRGADSFTYSVSDSHGGFGTAMVTIAPVPQAQTVLTPGQSYGVTGFLGLPTDVFTTGTSAGTEVITVGDFTGAGFSNNFSAGGDTIRVTGSAANFKIGVSGNQVVLTSAIDHIELKLPTGFAEITVYFETAPNVFDDSRSLCFIIDASDFDMLPDLFLGDQRIMPDVAGLDVLAFA